jgi:microsomal dipeptidase-like Zn-dependent dipeptidase
LISSFKKQNNIKGSFKIVDVTGTPLIAAELLKLGFTRLEIEKIMGGNIRDFFLANLPE